MKSLIQKQCSGCGMNGVARLFAAISVMMACLITLPAAAKHKNFKLSVYVRAYEVQKMKDTKWLESSWQLISSQLDVDKIYLETHRDLLIVVDATIEKAKKLFNKHWLEVS